MQSDVVTTVDKDRPVDREKTCPLLLRVFCNTGRHHDLSDYERNEVPSHELQMYTWMDATLAELASLVKEVNPDTRRKGTCFEFALVVPNHNSPGYRMRAVGTTCSGTQNIDDNKTLAQLRFTIGDYLDIAITPPMMPRIGMRMPIDRMDRMDRFSNYRDDRMGPPIRRMRPY